MKASELEDAVKTDEAVLVREPGILRTELLHDRDRVVLLATSAALGELSGQAAMASVRQALQVGGGACCWAATRSLPGWWLLAAG